MKSPFPGMDPFIEAAGLWGDFHHNLIIDIQRALAHVAPSRYVVRTGERSYGEEHREVFVEIYEATPEHRLVTSIEVLSPTNKRPTGPGRELYLRKRESHLLGEANLVEIDLLRGGEPMPMLDAWPKSPYTLLAARAGKAHACRVWPAHFDRALPPILVPLLKPDADLPLSLQPLVEGIYATSRYGQSIDYTKALQPPLQPEEKTWWEARLRTLPS